MQSILCGSSTTYMLAITTLIVENYSGVLSLYRKLPASQPKTIVPFSQKFYMLGNGNSIDFFNCCIKSS